eukprot:761633-Pyramimonas_sp.AAC.1
MYTNLVQLQLDRVAPTEATSNGDAGSLNDGRNMYSFRTMVDGRNAACNNAHLARADSTPTGGSDTGRTRRIKNGRLDAIRVLGPKRIRHCNVHSSISTFTTAMDPLRRYDLQEQLLFDTSNGNEIDKIAINNRRATRDYRYLSST